MHRIRALLDDVAHKIGLTKPLLGRARRRAKNFRERAEREHERQVKYQKHADELRASGPYNATQAPYEDARAARCGHRAERSHLKAIYWRGKVKVRLQRLHALNASQAQLEAELADWKHKHGVTISGNVATGGNPGQRWRAVLLASVANCANGVRRNFYSMSGAWDIDHVIVPGEAYGERSDCSSTVTGWAKAAGLPDPNGEDWHGGYTGTLVGQHNGWRQVSRTEMEASGKPAYIVYGSGTGHHTEAFLGHGVTAGHGSAPVDKGVVDLFGDGDYRCYIHD